jgi:FAD dependent oxidoreductase TIGR03364/phosphonatase-like hydrolase
MKKYDLAIIGGGVLGVFHAYHALNRGLKVVLMEQDATPQRATARNFGQVVPSGMNAKWQRFGRQSLDIYKEIQKKADISVRQNGSIYIASNAEELTLIHELAEINEVNGYPSQLWTANQCLAKYQGLKADYVVGGLFFPDEISLEPRRAVAQIIEYLLMHDHFDYFSNTLIEDIAPSANTMYLFATNQMRFCAEQVIICNGADFKSLYPEVFAQSDLEAVKIHMMETEDQPSQRLHGNILTGLSIRRYEAFSECPSWASVKAKEDAKSLAKAYGVHILFKQTTSGSVIIGDSHEYADAAVADHLGFDIRMDMQNFILEEAKQIFDLENWQIKRHWYGVYAQCKEQDVFTHTIDDRVRIVTGIGGKGMTASAGYAETTILDLYGKKTSPKPQKQRQIELVVFDMAGTTVDEDNIVYKTVQKAIEKAGYKTSLDEVLLHGAGKEKLQAIKDVLLAKTNQHLDAEAAHIFQTFEVMLADAYATEEIKEQVGATKLFQLLNKHKIKVALNTGYNKTTTDYLLSKLGWLSHPHIHTVVCADDVVRGRPHPDMIHLAMKHCGIMDANKVIKIGDSAIDIEEGKQAGCRINLGITTGAQTKEQLLMATPNGILNHLSELANWI